MKTKSKLGRFFGYLALAVISIGVFLFLASHSLNFFQFTFTEQDELYSWLGLLLTSGGVIGWLAVFVWLADTTLQKGISLIMMLVALAGEMITAVFDMQNNAMYAGGLTFLPQELKTMTMLIGILGAVTGLALIGYAAGDKILDAFKDDDSDGIPNFIDRTDNRNGKDVRQPNSNHKTMPKVEEPDKVTFR